MEENGNLDRRYLSADTALTEANSPHRNSGNCQEERSVMWRQCLNRATVWVRGTIIGSIVLITLVTLRSCSVPPQGPAPFATEEEINLLVRMLYSEQAGQDPTIMRAAAWVAINRVLDTENFPKVNSLEDALIPGQFFVRSQEDINSRIETNPLEAAAWEQAQHIALEVIYEYRTYSMANDLLDGALFFANVMRGNKAKAKYEELLKEAGVKKYGILKGNTCWFFYNATASVPVPVEIRPEY